MFRKFFTKLNKAVSKQIVAARYDYAVPIKLTFEPDKHTGKLGLPINDLYIIGETMDLSHTGIAFVVSSVRLKEYYLVGEGRTLNAELDLPTGKVKLQIVGQRYEQIGEHISVSQYLIGAKITNMTKENREAYEHFLQYGKKMKKRTRTLQLGIDES